jgi:hypothetical protein
MTKKARLVAWADALGLDCGTDATAAQLESAIENAISQSGDSADEPRFTLRDGIAANLAVLRQELPSTFAAVGANLFGGLGI